MFPITARPSRTLALGTWLATRGAMATVGMAMTTLGGAAAIVAALALARGGSRVALRLPTIASEAIAWSGGVMLAFGAALRAIDRDREEGILALVRARGASVADYVRGRVGGLVLLLAASVGGATLAGVLATMSTEGIAGTLRQAIAAFAYAIAFSITIGPVAMAALGATTRIGGYLTLVFILFVPELISPWTSSLLPRGWQELTSIPAALEAVRAAVASPTGALAPGARALAALGAVVAVSLLVVAARAGRMDAGQNS